MFKTILAPVQAWLLSQGKCVGCAASLAEGIVVTKSQNENEVTCKKCGRIFLYNRDKQTYQRAPAPRT